MENKNKNSIKLLLIEDNELDQLAFERFFKTEFPCQYTISNSVKNSIIELENNKFDIIVSDFNLGDGTALDILKILEKRFSLKDQNEKNILNKAFIVVTGAGDEETVVKLMKEGVSDYIVKDMNFNFLKILPITIERAINRISVENEIREKNMILNGILNNIPIIVFRTDENGLFTEIIGSGLKRFNIDEKHVNSSIIGKKLFGVFCDLSESIVKGINLVFNNPGRSSNFVGEIEINNIIGHFENYIFFDQERSKGAIGFSIDITEKKEAEAKLNQVYLGVQDVFSSLSKFSKFNQDKNISE